MEGRKHLTPLHYQQIPPQSLCLLGLYSRDTRPMCKPSPSSKLATRSVPKCMSVTSPHGQTMQCGRTHRALLSPRYQLFLRYDEGHSHPDES